MGHRIKENYFGDIIPLVINNIKLYMKKFVGHKLMFYFPSTPSVLSRFKIIPILHTLNPDKTHFIGRYVA